MDTNSTSISFEQGLSLNLLSVFMNAVAITLSKFALSNINPIFITLIICLTSTFLSFTYLSLRQHSFTKSELKQLLPIGLINAAATMLLYASIAMLEPITVGMIGRFYVVFTTLLSVVILREKMTNNETFLIAVAILGTFLFVQTGQTTNAMHYIGVAMGLSYTFLFALANLLVKRNVHKANSVTILFYNNFFACIACALFLLSEKAPLASFSSMSLRTYGFAILTATITFLGLVLFFNSFRFLSFKLSNIIRSTSPIFVFIVSWPFFPIQISVTNASGGAMVLTSIIFLSLIERKRQK